MKKLKVIRKVQTFFVVMVICIQRTMNTKIKLTCDVFYTKKIVPVLAILNSGSFSIIKTTIKSFAEIGKTKILSKNKERV